MKRYIHVYANIESDIFCFCAYRQTEIFQWDFLCGIYSLACVGLHLATPVNTIQNHKLDWNVTQCVGGCVCVSVCRLVCLCVCVWVCVWMLCDGLVTCSGCVPSSQQMDGLMVWIFFPLYILHWSCIGLYHILWQISLVLIKGFKICCYLYSLRLEAITGHNPTSLHALFSLLWIK